MRGGVWRRLGEDERGVWRGLGEDERETVEGVGRGMEWQ